MNDKWKKTGIWVGALGTAVLVTVLAGVWYAECLWQMERRSFFSFSGLYIRQFFSEGYLLPGRESSHPLWQLAGNFFLQFCKGPGAYVTMPLAGLVLGVLLMVLLRRRHPALRISACISGAVLLVFAFFSFRLPSRQDLLLARVERLCIEERYDEVLELSDRYWFSHPCPIEDAVTGINTMYPNLSAREIAFRGQLASYTKTALIGSHRLNEKFFTYYRTPEIYNGLDDAYQAPHSLTGMLRSRALDNPTLTYVEGLNFPARSGFSYANLTLSVPAMIACRQWDLARKHIRVLEQTLFYRRTARRYQNLLDRFRQACAQSGDLAEIYRATGLMPAQWEVLDSSPSFYEESYRRWEQNPVSLAVLEYINLYDLLYKNLDAVIARLPAYIRLTGQQPPYMLPAPWQEMFRIVQREGIPVPDSVRGILQKTEWSPEVQNLYERFMNACFDWQYQKITAQTLTEKFGHLFAYNFYFSRFVFVDPRTGRSRPMSH